MSDVKQTRKGKKVQAPKTGTKMDTARKVYERMEGKARKDIILAMIDKAGLTPAGASTYFQKFAAGNGKHVAGVRGRPADENSLAGQARALFKKLGKKAARKDVIQQFVNLGLTKAGAATYYQSIKKAA